MKKCTRPPRKLSPEQEQTVFDCLQRKSVPDLRLALAGIDTAAARLIVALVDLHGDDSVLANARELFADRAPAALAAVVELATALGGRESVASGEYGTTRGGYQQVASSSYAVSP